jgi:hypothetical protein
MDVDIRINRIDLFEKAIVCSSPLSHYQTATAKIGNCRKMLRMLLDVAQEPHESSR